jgi:mono/diheme cytochrome c family protein
LNRALTIVAVLAVSTAACAQDRGAALFEANCAVCHEKQGEGIPGFAPRLAGNLAGRARNEAGRRYFAQLVVSGMMGPIVSGGEKFNDAMPSFASLADGDIVAVVGYVLTGLNQVPAESNITAEDVAAARKRALPPNEVRRLREQ